MTNLQKIFHSGIHEITRVNKHAKINVFINFKNDDFK